MRRSWHFLLASLCCGGLTFAAIGCWGQAAPRRPPTGTQPVAWYTFDSGQGPVADDQSGRENDARIYGAAFTRTREGFALRFDGVDDYVFCGDDPVFNMETAVTLEAWVNPDAVPADESGIVGKGVDSYALTYYRDGRVYFYVSGGPNNCKAALAPKTWQHVVGTYDGQVMRLYVDGELRDSRRVQTRIPKGGPLLIGDRGDRRGNHFAGRIDEVRVYAQAVPAAEVKQAFAASEYSRLAPVAQAQAVASLQAPGYRLSATETGALRLQIGTEAYTVQSTFSAPGASIRYNTLGERGSSVEPGWSPAVTEIDAARLRISAAGPSYSLVREVALQGERVLITDTLENRAGEDVGVLVENRLLAEQTPLQTLLSGVREGPVAMAAENPTLFVACPQSSVGVLAEDTPSRLQFTARAVRNRSEFSLERFGLKAGARQTLRWTLYPQGPGADYYTFINRVREDWNTNFTVHGPFMFFNVFEHRPLLRDPARLRTYLGRNRLKVVALMPWLDYENFDPERGRPINRNEYRALMQQARAALKAADPEIRCLGAIESNLVTPPEELARALYEALPPGQREAGIFPFTDRQMQIIRGRPLRWKDCLVMGPDGKYRYELYYRGNQRAPLMALAVYAKLGNTLYQYWLEQARFIMDDVGLDGVYIDQFSLAFDTAQRFSYDEWDGVTVDIDRQTGRIERRLTDSSLAGAEARREFTQFVLGRRGFMVANTHPAVRETQSLPVMRFTEAEFSFNPLKLERSTIPPLLPALTKGQLASPIMLGYRPDTLDPEGSQNYARVIMQSVITYLRHGQLYYHYRTDIPETGPGAGGYGPINHMFPLTPVALHEGWIEGRERIVTAVSGTYAWRRADRPEVRRFDIRGREVPHGAAVTRSGAGWTVTLRLDDWGEVAVIE